MAGERQDASQYRFTQASPSSSSSTSTPSTQAGGQSWWRRGREKRLPAIFPKVNRTLYTFPPSPSSRSYSWKYFLQRRPFLSMVDPPGISIAFDQRQTIPLSHEIHFVFNLMNWKVTFLSTHQVPASWPRQYCRLVARTSQFYLFPRSCTLLCFVLWVCNHPVPSSTNILYPGKCLHQMWIASFIGLATMVRP